jgi:hypothetical protein
MDIEVTVNIGVKKDLPEIIGAAYDNVIDLLREDVNRKIIENGLEFHDTMGTYHKEFKRILKGEGGCDF